MPRPKDTPPQDNVWNPSIKEFIEAVESGQVDINPPQKKEELEPNPEAPEGLKEILERDYPLQLRVHREAGLLESVSVGEGHKAINGQDYAFPSQSEVIERLANKRELIERKLAQYTNPKIIITPIGKRIVDITECWKKTINQYKDKLHNRDGSKITPKDTYDMTAGSVENNNAPVWLWKEYQNDDKVIYDPEAFNNEPAKHKGKSKSQVLDTIGGYSIILMEDMDMPRENQAVEKVGRTPLEANKDAHQYLKILKEDRQ